jgi:murein DD-endopeptidase MepM/ murein hydrolase activator NlpD
MDNKTKGLIIGGAFMLTYLLYKLGFKGYTITKSEWANLNATNRVNLPMKGKIRMTSPYGNRLRNNVVSFHNGVDLVSKEGQTLGQPIYAPLSGTIVSNFFDDRGGYQVILDSGYARFGFAHLQSKSQLAVKTKVTKGQVIGYVGNTGTSTGAHLHFTLRLDGQTVDPVSNIKALKNAVT